MRRRNKPGGIYVQAPKKRRSLLKALLGVVLLLAIVGAIANAANKNQAAVPQGAAPVVAAATSQPTQPAIPTRPPATATPRKPSHFSVVASVDPAAVPAGDNATLYLHTRIGSTCTATARYDGGAAAPLSKKPVHIGHTGIAPWVWKVRTGATGGTATGICHWKGHVKRITARFAVIHPMPTATTVPTVPPAPTATPTPADTATPADTPVPTDTPAPQYALSVTAHVPVRGVIGVPMDGSIDIANTGAPIDSLLVWLDKADANYDVAGMTSSCGTVSLLTNAGYTNVYSVGPLPSGGSCKAGVQLNPVARGQTTIFIHTGRWDSQYGVPNFLPDSLVEYYGVVID